MYEKLIQAVSDFHGDLVRNIKGIRQSQNLFDDLSGDPADQAAAIIAESATRIPTAAPMITRPFDYGTVITYPFLPQNWQATRVSDGLRYGVWYGSLELETTVYETVHHRQRFLQDAFAGEDRTIANERRHHPQRFPQDAGAGEERTIANQRRVFDLRCDPTLIDLRGKEKKEKRL